MSGSPAQHKSGFVQILIVEDNPPDVYLLQLAIRQECPDCLFDIVDTGRDAFQFLRREGRYENALLPDLVILDLNLPFRTGEEVLGLIRTTEQLRDVIVILCSSSPRDLDFRSVHVPDAYITKPADLDSYLALGKEIMNCYWSRKDENTPGTSTASASRARGPG
jgi:CheY-like chemotaxis protein